MNKVILMGRLTRDAEVRYSQGESSSAIARFTLAVDRRFRRNNEDQTSDSFADFKLNTTVFSSPIFSVIHNTSTVFFPAENVIFTQKKRASSRKLNLKRIIQS